MLDTDVRRPARPDYDPELAFDPQEPSHTQLLIVEQAHRLKMNGLERVRDFFDRSDMGVIIIGTPGFDRQLAPLPAALQPDRLRPPLRTARPPKTSPPSGATTWVQLGLPEEDLYPDGEPVNAAVRINGGNVRLIEQLMTQVGPPRDINDFRNITIDLITAASQILVIGDQ